MNIWTKDDNLASGPWLKLALTCLNHELLKSMVKKHFWCEHSWTSCFNMTHHTVRRLHKVTIHNVSYWNTWWLLISKGCEIGVSSSPVKCVVLQSQSHLVMEILIWKSVRLNKYFWIIKVHLSTVIINRRRRWFSNSTNEAGTFHWLIVPEATFPIMLFSERLLWTWPSLHLSSALIGLFCGCLWALIG